MYKGRSRIERGGGLYTRENAGMSSEREVGNLSVESLRIPGEGSSAQGKSGPKERLKSVSDGQLVEILAPPIYLKSNGDTVEEAEHARGKACAERDTEKYSREAARITLARKAIEYCI